MSTSWLAAHLNDPSLRILDARGLERPHAGGHIPGALFVDSARDLVDHGAPVPLEVASGEQAAAVFGSLGIGDDTPVVVYDDSFGVFASRVLWVLRFYGHERARVLDGGLVKWRAEGQPLSHQQTFVAPAAFGPCQQPALRRTAADVQAALGGDALLLDARYEGEYVGAESRVVRGGHIPGAVNLCYRTVVSGPHQTFVSPAALRALLASVGVDIARLAERAVIVYCNGGYEAAVLALGVELASGVRPALYDGSWNEWGGDLRFPARRGMAPGGHVQRALAENNNGKSSD